MATTIQELEAQVKYINHLAKKYEILQGGEWVDIPENLAGSRYTFPFLGLDKGSVTYGRAWRLYASGGSKYHTAHFDPFHSASGFLGMTKTEAMATLRGIRLGLDAMYEANKEHLISEEIPWAQLEKEG